MKHGEGNLQYYRPSLCGAFTTMWSAVSPNRSAFMCEEVCPTSADVQYKGDNWWFVNLERMGFESIMDGVLGYHLCLNARVSSSKSSQALEIG